MISDTAHPARLPLSLQGVPADLQRKIGGHLTFTDAVSLMLTSSRLCDAIKTDRLLRLDQISPLFKSLGCNELVRSIQSIDCEIAGPGSRQHGVLSPEAAPRSISFAGHCFTLQQSVVTKALRARVLRNTERARQAQERESKAQRAVLAQRLEQLEPEIEAVAFHFAAERLEGPRPVQPANAPLPLVSPATKKEGWLLDAMERGDVPLLRAGLREFLGLPAPLMPNERKIAWLRQPQRKDTLAFFGQHGCGYLKAKERAQYEAITAYIDEIVSSDKLNPDEKRQLCLRPGGLDIFQHALRRSNPAVATSLLLGIHESSADPRLKHYLLGTLFDAWSGRDNCVGFVISELRKYRYRAPEWVDAMTARLGEIKAASRPAVETKD